MIALKLSIVLSAQPTSFSPLAYRGELKKNIAKIHDLGYGGVELAVRDPRHLQPEEIERMLAANCLPVPAIGTGQAFGEEGLSFTHPNEHIREKAVERIKEQMALAARWGAVVIIGLIRGNNARRVGYKRAESWFAEALAECASADRRVRLALEPINRYETDLINTVDSGLGFLDRLKLDQVGLLLDSFHMNIEEPSMIKSIESAGERLFHFHVADSNRWYPGAGHIRFPDLIDALTKIGYDGFLSAEIMPMPDPDTSAVRTIENMRKWLT